MVENSVMKAAQQPLRTHYDAIVVGGGHNGLVAAGYLARAGQSVLVLERNQDLGGATSSHAIFAGMPARLSRYSYLVSLLPDTIVRDLGLRFTTRRRVIASCTPFERGGTAGALILSNQDERRSQEAIEAVAGYADWHGYQALLELERAFAALVWPSLLQPLRTRKQWKAGISAGLTRTAWEAFVERPLGETIEHYLKDDLLRGLVFTDAKIGLFTHAYDQTLLQNRCFIYHTIGHGTGEWQVPVGGMGAFVDELAASARASGAALVTNAEVQAIHPGKPYHTVVWHLEGSEQTTLSTRVLVGAGPQVFARLLDIPYVPDATDEGSVAKVNMLLRKLPRLRASQVDSGQAFGGTFHIDEGYEAMQASFRQASVGQLPAPAPAEIYCHTLTDNSILGADLRAAGYHTLTLFGLDVPYRLFERDPEAQRARLLESYLGGINRLLAEPIQECVATDAAGNPCIEIKLPQDLETELCLNRGNIFHAALSWFFTEDEQLAGSWGVETAYPRIYRCGASATRGGAVSGIPGRNAARKIFEELGVPQRAES